MTRPRASRSRQVQERLRQARSSNWRMFVILALVAVIGGWGGHQRIQDRIEARAATGAKAASVPAAPSGLALEVIAPNGAGPGTVNALERAMER